MPYVGRIFFQGGEWEGSLERKCLGWLGRENIFFTAESFDFLIKLKINSRKAACSVRVSHGQTFYFCLWRSPDLGMVSVVVVFVVVVLLLLLLLLLVGATFVLSDQWEIQKNL